MELALELQNYPPKGSRVSAAPNPQAYELAKVTIGNRGTRAYRLLGIGRTVVLELGCTIFLICDTFLINFSQKLKR